MAAVSRMMTLRRHAHGDSCPTMGLATPLCSGFTSLSASPGTYAVRTHAHARTYTYTTRTHYAVKDTHTHTHTHTHTQVRGQGRKLPDAQMRG